MLSFLTRLFGRSADQPEPISSNPEPISEQIAPEPVAPVGSSEIKTPFSQTADSTTGEAQRSETPNRPKYEDLMSELLNRKLAVKQAEDDLDCGGGVHINGGPITVGGDIVGRDRIVVVSDGTINRLFEPLLIEAQKIEPETLHAEARQCIIKIRDQAKCYEPDLVVVGKALKWLTKNTPSFAPKLREILAESCIPRSVRELAVVLLELDDLADQ